MRIIAGQLRGRTIGTGKRAPEGVRPTSDRTRETIFNILNNIVDWDAVQNVADVCAGMGTLGFEAISRGAEHCTFIEKSKKTARGIADSAAILSVQQQCTIINDDAVRALQHLAQAGNKCFDIIFTDPPYALQLAGKIFHVIATTPIITTEGLFIAETGIREHIETPENWNIVTERALGDTRLWIFQKL
jgi:16S rRNA (guanine966-N2)-methyltransferase